MQSCKAQTLQDVFNHLSLRKDVQVEDKVVEVIRNHQIAAIQFALSALVISNIILEALAMIKKSPKYRYYMLRLQSHWNIVMLELIDIWVSTSMAPSRNLNLKTSEIFSIALQKVRSLLNSELSHLIAFSCICLIAQSNIRFTNLPFIILEFPYLIGSIVVLLSLVFPDYNNIFKLFLQKYSGDSEEEFSQPNISTPINSTQPQNISSTNDTTNLHPTNETAVSSPQPGATIDGQMETLAAQNNWRSTLSYVVESFLLFQMNFASDDSDSLPIQQSKKKRSIFSGIFLLLLPAMRWLLSINYFFIRTKYILSDVWGWNRNSGGSAGNKGLVSVKSVSSSSISSVWRRFFPRKTSYKSAMHAPHATKKKNDTRTTTEKTSTKKKKKRRKVDAGPIGQKLDRNVSSTVTATTQSAEASTIPMNSELGIIGNQF